MPLRRHAFPAALVVIVAVFGAGCGRRSDGIPTTRLTQVTVTDAAELPGQVLPARTDTARIWLAADRTRRDTGAKSFVMRVDTGRMIVIDHAQKAFLDVSLDDAGRLLSGLATRPDSSSHPRDRTLRGLYRVAAKVTDTGEKAPINGYQCRRYVLELHLGDTQMISEQWVTQALGIDDGQLRRASFAALLGLPGGVEAMAELARVQGVPVRSTTITSLFGRSIH